METKRDHKEAQTSTAGSQPEGHHMSLGAASIVLAGVAIVGVFSASIWALAPRHEGSAIPSTAASATSVAEPRPAEARATIYVWDPNGGEPRQLYSVRTPATDAELSGDGTRLVYTGVGSDGVSQVYLLDSGGKRRLTDLPGGALEPTWSPDGSRIAFSASRRQGAHTDIFVMNADGSGVRHWFGTQNEDGHPDWSPDGRLITFDSRYRNLGGLIWVASVRTRAKTLLTPGGTPFGAADPAWSPDGRRIAYSRYSRSTLNGDVVMSAIWVMRPDGTDKTRVGKPARLWDLASKPSWSPDGRFIAFEPAEKGVSIIDPRTGRQARVFSATTGLSWGRKGMLVIVNIGASLNGRVPVSPDPVPQPPRWLRVFRGVDVTITMTSSACSRDGALRPVPTGRLTVALANDSRLDGWFHLVPLGQGQTVAEVPRLLSSSKLDRYVDASEVGTLSTRSNVDEGRWAVVCWKDLDLSGKGFAFRPVDVVTIRISHRAGG